MSTPESAPAVEDERPADGPDARLAARAASVPELRYPEDLPVSQRREDLLAAIRDHQVVIVAGETGSGKTTQLPKICLELGRGISGLIGHTQPRRIAARTVAERIAEELGTPLGQVVGYSVRFTDKVSDATLVRLMTDGVLLAEINRDRMLRKYDTIIIDEAHERSLNVDFLLGYLKTLLPKRPDLKVIVTSATIDPEKFSRHFDDAPIIEVSGRTYPVEVRYRPLLDVSVDDEDDEPAAAHEEARDPVQAVCDAVGELTAEGDGDILVFCSGEREIRDTADALRGMGLPLTEVLPLYARLSAAEQHLVFEPHTGRRVVLATNVAETSLTVPGIRYVVDPGTARISRWSTRTGVQRLPIEPVSQASARQRAGRCGRIAPGICIRLYAESDFDSRPEFTDPEIQRTSLAAVVLQMAALRIGEIEEFPFLDPPERASIRDAVTLLHELAALEVDSATGGRKLTEIGRRLARLPVDPRLGRAILEGDRRGCLNEVIIIVAALSIQDPRERPSDEREQADAKHRRFADEFSDFLSLLNLWKYLREQQEALSSSQFRRMCKQEYLHYLRVREWQDLRGQLRSIAREVGMVANSSPAEPDPREIHMALLAGMLSRIGLRDPEKRDYQGARGTRFALWPGSVLARKTPRWVMAAELVETSRLWGRTVARIDPSWIEPLAGHLVARVYNEPAWDRARGAVMAVERVSLYGLPIVTGRRVSYGRVNPELARELFIQHALVEDDWDTHHRFAEVNQDRRAEVAELAARARRTDFEPNEAALYDFFDARVPASAVSQAHFDSWWKKARHEMPGLLELPLDLLLGPAATEAEPEAFPDDWVQGSLRFPLEYRFSPGADDDGVTVTVPLAQLGRLDGDRLSWQVPGLRVELVTALLRGLPKAVRRTFGPAPEVTRALLESDDAGKGPLLETLGRDLQRVTATPLPAGAWKPEQLPPYLRIRVRVVDDAGDFLAVGRSLDEVRAKVRPLLRRQFRAATASVERTGLTDWGFGALDRTVTHEVPGAVLRGFPALTDEGASVAVRVYESEAEQARAMRAGTRRLLLMTLPSQAKALRQRLSPKDAFALTAAPGGDVAALLDDVTGCAVDHLVAEAGGVVWDQEAFVALRQRIRAELPAAAGTVLTRVLPVLAAMRQADARLAALPAPALAASLTDVREQRDRLLAPGFATAAGWDRLPHLLRYAQAMDKRLERLPQDPTRDRENTELVRGLQTECDELARAIPGNDPRQSELEQIRWALEELRVSLFAQGVRTAFPVSPQRVARLLDDLAAR